MTNTSNTIVGVLGVVIAFCAGWQSKQQSSEVSATRFVLVDSSGKELASLGSSATGVVLKMTGGEGTVELAAKPEEATLTLKSKVSDAALRAYNSGSTLAMWMPNGSHVFSQASDNGASISFNDAKHKRGAKMGAEDLEAYVSLFSKSYFTQIATYDEFNRFSQDIIRPQ